MKLKFSSYWQTSFFFILLGLSQDTFADSFNKLQNITINVAVTIQAATCDISSIEGGDIIEVDFNSISKQGIEKSDYKLEVPFMIVCSDDSPSLTLKLSGDSTDFDSTLLRSISNDNLGFEFQLNDKKLALEGISSNFTTQSIPTLSVVPKLNSKATNLVAGDFTSASAKLILNYQ